MLVFFDNEINLFVFRVDLGGGYMIPVGRDDILSRLAEIPAVLYILHKLYHVKGFIPARRDPSYVPPGSRVIASARLSGMKK